MPGRRHQRRAAARAGRRPRGRGADGDEPSPRRRLRRPAIGRGVRRADRAGAQAPVALRDGRHPAPAPARSTRRAPATACSSCRPSSRSAPGSRPASPALLDWPLENGEGLQILRYRPGAEYKPHYDYFDPAEPGTPAILKRGGQRLASIVCYLNTPEAGGATVFPEAGIEVAPVRGNAVFFSYDRPHPSTRTLHGGAPVTRRREMGRDQVDAGRPLRITLVGCQPLVAGPALSRPSNRLVIRIPRENPRMKTSHHRRRRFRIQPRRLRRQPRGEGCAMAKPAASAPAAKTTAAPAAKPAASAAGRQAGGSAAGPSKAEVSRLGSGLSRLRLNEKARPRPGFLFAAKRDLSRAAGAPARLAARDGRAQRRRRAAGVAERRLRSIRRFLRSSQVSGPSSAQLAMQSSISLRSRRR